MRELLDVSTGIRQVIHRSKDPFEAPNWTADGAALIYNTSGRGEGGRLYRFELATRRSTLIDTGFAIRNNNDRVLALVRVAHEPEHPAVRAVTGHRAIVEQ